MKNSHIREILVVDDDPVIRDMMVDIFELEGYPVSTVRNGREALERLYDDKDYLVFLDLMMPIMDGYEVCEQLNAEPQMRKRHIIVVMSALDNLALVATLNVDAKLPKPFSVDEVISIVEPYMS